MNHEIAIALIALVGDLGWPAAALIAFLNLKSGLQKGWLTQVLPHGGSIEIGNTKIAVEKALSDARHATDQVAGIEEAVPESAESARLDTELDPYELVMDSWFDLADELTAFAVKHDGYDDRRQVWSNLEHLVERNVISEEEMGAVRDLQKARNSIRRLQEVDRATANRFAETARRLTRKYQEMLS